MEKSENTSKDGYPELDTYRTKDAISGEDVYGENLSAETLTWTDEKLDDAKMVANQHREIAVSKYHRLRKHNFADLSILHLGKYSKLVEVEYSTNGLPFLHDHINLFPDNPLSVSTEEKLGGRLCTRLIKEENKDKNVSFGPLPARPSTDEDNNAVAENPQPYFLRDENFRYDYFVYDYDSGKYVSKVQMDDEENCSVISAKKRKFSSEEKASKIEFEFEFGTEKCSRFENKAFPTLQNRNVTKEMGTTINFSQLSELSQSSQYQHNKNDIGNCICEVQTEEVQENEKMRNYVLTQYSNSGSEEGSRAINIDNIVDEINGNNEKK